MKQSLGKKVKTLVVCAAVRLAVVGAKPVKADLIDFTADAVGAKPNGFISNGNTGNLKVTITDTLGAGLQVGDFGDQSIGKALAVFDDDQSGLLMGFSSLANFLSLSFGNECSRFNSGRHTVRTYRRSRCWPVGMC